MIFGITIGVGVVGIIAYFIVTLIADGLHDFKYLLFLNGKSILKAVIIADIYAVFNNCIIKTVANIDLLTTNIITIICVSLSITAAMLYDRKHLKETIHTYTISTKYPDIRFELKDEFVRRGIPYKYHYYYFQNDKDIEEEKSLGITVNEFGETLYHEYEILSFSKKHSKALDEIVQKYPKHKIKYLPVDTTTVKDKLQYRNIEASTQEEFKSELNK